MQILINTDRNIKGSQSLSKYITDAVESALSRISDQLTRVEVHVGDEDGDKVSKDDMRCMMEARLKGRQPVAVTERAATLEQAVDGAADKLARKLDSILGRQRDQQRHGSNPPEVKPPITGQK